MLEMHFAGGKMKRFTLILTISIVVVLGALSGCSSGSSDKASGSMNGGASTASSEQALNSAAAPAEMMKAAGDANASDAGSGTAVKSAAAFGTGTQAIEESGDQNSLNRKIVYKANITMQVEDYAKAQTALRNLIHLSGGYLLQFSDQKTGNELGGNYTVKIPASGFTGFLAELEKIEHLDYQSSVNGTDVTEEFVDLDSRLKARQVAEARLLSFMEKATRADDLVKFSQQLSNVQTEIEQIKGRMRYLNQNVAYSTVELRLYQEVESAPGVKKKGAAFGTRLSEALTGNTELLYRLLQGLVVFIAGALPYAAVLAVVGLPVYYVFRRRRNKHGAEGGPASSAPIRAEAADQPVKPAGQPEDAADSGKPPQDAAD